MRAEGETAQSSDGKEEISEEEEPVMIDKEWWDRNYVWHYRSPYFTGALMDKLKPYVKKLEKTAAWKANDEYLRSFGEPVEEMTLEERWKIAKEWHEREDPKAFWKKQSRKLQKKKLEGQQKALLKFQKQREKDNLKFSSSKHGGH